MLCIGAMQCVRAPRVVEILQMHVNRYIGIEAMKLSYNKQQIGNLTQVHIFII